MQPVLSSPPKQSSVASGAVQTQTPQNLSTLTVCLPDTPAFVRPLCSELDQGTHLGCFARLKQWFGCGSLRKPSFSYQDYQRELLDPGHPSPNIFPKVEWTHKEWVDELKAAVALYKKWSDELKNGDQFHSLRIYTAFMSLKFSFVIFPLYSILSDEAAGVSTELDYRKMAFPIMGLAVLIDRFMTPIVRWAVDAKDPSYYRTLASQLQRVEKIIAKDAYEASLFASSSPAALQYYDKWLNKLVSEKNPWGCLRLAQLKYGFSHVSDTASLQKRDEEIAALCQVVRGSQNKEALQELWAWMDAIIASGQPTQA